MPLYRIVNEHSGVMLGEVRARDTEHALELVAQESGYGGLKDIAASHDCTVDEIVKALKITVLEDADG